MLWKNETNNHSVFNLHYHLILVTKYRKQVITQDIKEELRSIFERVGESYGIRLEELGTEPDHAHFVFAAKPNSDLSKFMNAFKSASSRLIKKQHPEIKQQLWKEYFWSQSYYLVTTGGASLEIIQEYVKTQGENTPRYETANRLNAITDKINQQERTS